jgi:hypothetical protein
MVATSTSGIACSALPSDPIQLLQVLFREVNKVGTLAHLGEYDRVLLLSDRLVPLVEARRDQIVSY